jgi:hypothetical protein
VVLRSQGTRPADGRVNVLAYTPGEEDFTDLNGNNAWDAGEPFADMGDAFRDDNENGLWDAGEFQVRRGGASACAGTASARAPGRADTCDGVWGATEVRRQIRIVFATSEASFGTPSPAPQANGTFEVTVSDRNGNSLPAGSTLAAAVRTLSETSACTVALGITEVPNGVLPTVLRVTTLTCEPGDRVILSSRSPAGIPSEATFVVN